MTTSTALQPDLVPPLAPQSRATVRSGRRAVWQDGYVLASALGLLLVVLGLVTGQPTCLLVGLGMAVAGVVPRAGGSLAVVSGTVLCMVLGPVLLGLAADTTGATLNSRPGLLSAAYVCGAAAGLASAAHRASARPTRPVMSLELLAYLPAAVAAGGALLQGVSTKLASGWALAGTDIAQHMIALAALQETGRLDYSADLYPRGLHTLLALISAPSAPTSGSPELVAYDLRLWSATVWMALAVLLWCVACLTLRLSQRAGLPRPAGVLTALLVTVAIPSSYAFQVSFLVMGPAPAVLAVVLLWMVPALAAHTTPSRLVLTAAGVTCALAHLWQPLALVPAGGAAAVLLSRRSRVAAWRTSLRHPRVLGSTAALAVLAAATLVPLLAAAKAGGSSIAGIPGVTPGVSSLVLLATAAAVALSLSAGAAVVRAAWGGSWAGVAVVLVVLLHGSGSWDLQQYYPMKVLWMAVLLAAPWSALGTVLIGRRLARLGAGVLERAPSVARFARAGVALAVVGLLAALVAPGLTTTDSVVRNALTGHERDRASGHRLDIALRFGSEAASGRVHVPVLAGLSPHGFAGPQVVSKLLSMQTGQALTFGQAADVCADVALASAGRPAAVITDLRAADLRPLMQAGGCAHVPVVHLPGTEPALVAQVAAKLRAAQRDGDD